MFHKDGQRCIGIEWHGTGEGFIVGDAERVDVTAGIAVAVQALLGSHVTERTHQRAGDRVLRSADDLGNAEIGEYGLAAPGQHDVGRLQVAVRDAFPVCIRQPGQNIGKDTHHFAERQFFRMHTQRIQIGFEGVAFKQFHDHVIQVILYIEVEDLNDVGMPQGGDCTGFPPETGQEFFLFHQV